MKRFLSLLSVALLAGFLTLGAYKLFLEPDRVVITESTTPNTIQPTTYKVNNTGISSAAESGIDFSVAAEKTVHAVVHVKQYGLTRQPRNLMEYLRNGGAVQKQIQGAGSGVIITEDGYIVTNNHVIDGASELEVTLNNNKTYKAEVVGTAPQADIALLKIDADEKLSYIPFGDSNSAKIGEWVLAVGNPFNLTSTVTAGIISAKSRDLNEYDGNYQSFIQTDAAVNPGNSGGALVNTRGELIGINTAITSLTGSYIGYSFAVPSNNAKKIIDDIIEYGNVQKAIIGITGGNLNQEIIDEYNLPISQGVYVESVDETSGAKIAGIQKGDIIKEIDNLQIQKFSDLTGYINSKRPGDLINIKFLRDGKELTRSVELKKYEIQTFKIKEAGIEIANPKKEYLKKYGAKNGVVIIDTSNPRINRLGIVGLIVEEVNGEKVESAQDVKNILDKSDPNNALILGILNKEGTRKNFVFD